MLLTGKSADLYENPSDLGEEQLKFLSLRLSSSAGISERLDYTDANKVFVMSERGSQYIKEIIEM